MLNKIIFPPYILISQTGFCELKLKVEILDKKNPKYFLKCSVRFMMTNYINFLCSVKQVIKIRLNHSHISKIITAYSGHLLKTSL